MTASKTPRLGLMSPVGSDAFVTNDFATTFDTLDKNPGTLVVPNAAARPTTYTAAQNGSMVYQSDLNILWSWNQPSSGQAGSWRRVGNVGLLRQSVASGQVSTTQTNYLNGTEVASMTFTVPGGRPIQVAISWDILGNNYEKAVISYWENGGLIISRAVWGLHPAVSRTPVSAGTWVFARDPAPNNSLLLTTRVTVAAYNASPSNGGGTTVAQGVQIAVWET